MIDRLAALALAVCVAFVLLGGSASAETYPGARLAFLRLAPGTLEIRTSDSSGGTQVRVAGGREETVPLPLPFSSPGWSPDGSSIAFGGAGEGGFGRDQHVYVVPAEAGSPRPIPGTDAGMEPIYSPDGQRLAFIKVKGSNSVSAGLDGKTRRTYARTSIWIVGIDGTGARRLTPWRKNLGEFPSSFAPGGSELLITASSRRPFRGRVIALGLASGKRRLILERAIDAVYSPDGRRIALLTLGTPRTIKSSEGTTTFTPTELAVAAPDGSGLTEITQTATLELEPSWDPSGQRLAYLAVSAGGGERTALGIGDRIMQINADGSCPTRVLSYPGAGLYGPAWRPGPGREAGPIAC